MYCRRPANLKHILSARLPGQTGGIHGAMTKSA